MPCHHMPVDGMNVIVCTRGRRYYCASCRAPSTFQCDWKIGKKGNGKPKTCDRHICKSHAQEVAPDKHLCPDHQRAYRGWLAARAEPVTGGSHGS